MNRTTNERFTKRAPTISQGDSRSSSLNSSVNTSLDDTLPIGSIPSDSPCWLVNCKEMCFNHNIADQKRLYEEHMIRKRIASSSGVRRSTRNT